MGCQFKAPRGLIIFAVMLSAIMVLIDLTIANVALPNMMGALGASADQITWVLTSYTMAEAICIPLTSFVAAKFGVRRVLLAGISCFIIASMLCGQAENLESMVFFRIIQGASGAAIIPLVQVILMSLYPDDRAKAMAIFSIGILVGPVLGPTLGGVITEHISWRWIFYVNLPIGLLCLGLLYRYVYVDERSEALMDWPTMLLMALGIGCLQYVLDRGNTVGWFDSKAIQVALIFSVMMLAGYAYRSFTQKSSVAPLWVMVDRNLLISSVMMFFFSMAVFGLTSQLPMFIENILDYPSDITGYVMSPRGLSSAIFLLIIMRLKLSIDPRLLIVCGMLLTAGSSLYMAGYSPTTDKVSLVLPAMVQGVGMGLMFSTLSTTAYATVSKEHYLAASSMYNMFRTIGSSFGISIAAMFQAHQGQQQWNSLGQGVSAYSPNLHLWLQQTGLDITQPKTIAILAADLERQAQTIAYIHTFDLVALASVITLPLLFLLALPARKSQTQAERP